MARDITQEIDDAADKPKRRIRCDFLGMGHYVGALFADTFENILGFIPNGLNVTYNATLKRLPVFKRFFGHAWVEESLKLFMGITIGRGLSRDLGQYLFWPLGFILGAPLGVFFPNAPHYKKEIGRLLYELSGPTVFGLLASLSALLVGVSLSPALSIQTLPWTAWLTALGAGAGVGLLSKTMILLAWDAFTRANAASSRLNARRAKKLGALLKERMKEKAHSSIYRHAKEMIEQVNGPQSQAHLQGFLAENHALVVKSVFKKIDRHLDYNVDRAAHGDMSALKRLLRLYRGQDKTQETLETLLDRMINDREIQLLKDKVDNLFDLWRYRDLKKAA